MRSTRADGRALRVPAQLLGNDRPRPCSGVVTSVTASLAAGRCALTAGADDRALGALAVANDYSAALYALRDRTNWAFPMAPCSDPKSAGSAFAWGRAAVALERGRSGNRNASEQCTGPSKLSNGLCDDRPGGSVASRALEGVSQGTRFKGGNEFFAGTVRSVCSPALGPISLRFFAREARNPDPRSRIIPA